MLAAQAHFFFVNYTYWVVCQSSQVWFNYKKLGLATTTNQPSILDPGCGKISFSLYLLLQVIRIAVTHIVCIIICIEHTFTSVSDSWKVIVKYQIRDNAGVRLVEGWDKAGVRLGDGWPKGWQSQSPQTVLAQKTTPCVWTRECSFALSFTSQAAALLAYLLHSDSHKEVLH